MSTLSRKSENAEYVQARTVPERDAAPTTVVSSPRQRVATASRTQGSVVLRFTPRTARQSNSEPKTS